eukprot:COSAG01_NODE_5215_length_4406_cov_2.137683_2_plen_200_part_00
MQRLFLSRNIETPRARVVRGRSDACPAGVPRAERRRGGGGRKLDWMCHRRRHGACVATKLPGSAENSAALSRDASMMGLVRRYSVDQSARVLLNLAQPADESWMNYGYWGAGVPPSPRAADLGGSSREFGSRGPIVGGGMSSSSAAAAAAASCSSSSTRGAFALACNTSSLSLSLSLSLCVCVWGDGHDSGSAPDCAAG